MKGRFFFRFCLSLILLNFTSCGSKTPMNYLQSFLEEHGYIAYKVPLQYSGAGTLIGGRPNALHLVAAPGSCFPEFVNGMSTKLYHLEDANLPNRHVSFKIKADGKVDLLNFLRSGSPSISARAGFQKIKEVEINFSGVKVEYLDSIALTEYYQQLLPDSCKDYLDKVGFIIQALRVDEMNFNFIKDDGAKLELNVNNIKNILDLGINTSYEIVDHVTLKITSPKYVAYQMAQLKRDHGGVALLRSTKVDSERDEYIFEDITNIKDAQQIERAKNLRLYYQGLSHE